MNKVEPTREARKILAIKSLLKAQPDPRDYVLFTLGLHGPKKEEIYIQIMQQKFGHTSPKTTRRYIGITQDEINGVEHRVYL